jgi:hypothetical protein
MARPSRKLPASSGGPWAYLTNLVPGEAPISGLTIDWQEIERAYGKKLSADVRGAMFAATSFFVLFEESERTGVPVPQAQTIIEGCKRRASEFQGALPSHESDGGLHAMLFITKNFNDNRVSYRLFGILHGLLTSFQTACNAALKELSEFPSLTEGDEWGSWVRRLNQILEGSGLPAGVRKDAGSKSKSDKPSPFTCLVWELQHFLPVACRRHTHSLGALATAISRALGSNKTPAPSE